MQISFTLCLPFLCSSLYQMSLYALHDQRKRNPDVSLILKPICFLSPRRVLTCAKAMTKIQVEVCLVSARGLRRSSSFWKLQWFAVGWIKPDQKYCSKIDSSGSSNPSWRTKFAVTIDASDTNLQDLCLTVEVHSREPLFLREKLYGTAIIQLKEFFLKLANNSDGLSSGIEEVGSFQLRKKRSEKPLGFVDVSIRISEVKTAIPSNTGR